MIYEETPFIIHYNYDNKSFLWNKQGLKLRQIWNKCDGKRDAIYNTF